jgi:transcriptional regulator NrdR family protein
MKCPKCEHLNWKTLDTRRDVENYDQACVLRRKQCLGCGHRIWTIEQILREIVKPEPKPRAPRAPKVTKDSKPSRAKQTLKRRVSAMLELESRRDSYDVFGPENDYLNKY